MGLIASPVTGSAVTGLTSPTYTLAIDSVAPGVNGVAYFVTTLGGTQAGVRTHSVSSPFSILATRPANPAILGTPNPSTGRIPNIQSNRYAIVIRKGVKPAADQPDQHAYARFSYEIPAGAETYDQPNVAALFSALGGLANGNATSLFNLAVTGTMTP